MPPFVADGVVIVDNATEFDIAKMKAKLAEAGKKFQTAAGACRPIEWRSAIEFPTQTLINEARSADLIIVEKATTSGDIHRTVDSRLGYSRSRRPLPGGTCSSAIPCR